MSVVGGVCGIIGLYVCAHLLIVVTASLLAGVRALNGVLPRRLTYRHMMGIGRVLAVIGILLPAFALWHGGSELSPVRAQVWAAPSMVGGAVLIAHDAQMDVGVDSHHAIIPVNAVAELALLALAVGLLLTLWPLFAEVHATFQAIRSAHVIRRIGSVCILVSDREVVPFAAWIPGRSIIVLPASFLLHPFDLRLALRHESQHHRQGDTRFLYAALLVRVLFGINPAVHWLTRQLFELQEFACDEALARRPGHCTRTYCDCLLRVAEAALGARQAQLRLFMAHWHGSALKRRVEAALREPVQSMPTPAAVCFSVVTVSVLVALSTMINVPVHDRRLDRAAAEQIAAATPGSSEWGVTVNDEVLEQLNLLLGTPDGRAFLNSSIDRMHNYEPALLRELKRYGLPPELLAVPLVESGYQNLPARRSAGAGLWMFVGPTARHYGLEVSAKRDERLDIAAESRAAMNMFSDLQHRFRNWPLTLLAYNSGVPQVEAGMNATHTRDVNTLYRAGYGNDPKYLAKTAAVMLILAHPRLLD